MCDGKNNVERMIFENRPAKKKKKGKGMLIFCLVLAAILIWSCILGVFFLIFSYDYDEDDSVLNYITRQIELDVSKGSWKAFECR